MKKPLKYLTNKDRIYISICILFSILLVVWSFDQYLARDSYYYWRWGQHLDWSYFDGPPLIAYLIRLCTKLFPDNNITLALINKVLLCLSCLMVYATARLSLDKSASIISAMFCFFFPLSISFIARGTTYDVPLFFFWACTLYFATKFSIHYRHYRFLNASGICIGFLMLSKYSGIILVLGLLYSAALQPQLRSIFTNKHVFFSIFLALLLFYPVVWWNYKHEWISFLYQLTIHKIDYKAQNAAFIILKNLAHFLLILNFFVFILWQLRPRKIKDAPPGIQLQSHVTWVFIGFNIMLCFSSVTL